MWWGMEKKCKFLFKIQRDINIFVLHIFDTFFSKCETLFYQKTIFIPYSMEFNFNNIKFLIDINRKTYD